MALDIKIFHRSNIVDTCSVWNILSSKILYISALANNCLFSCTSYVIYECLYKPRASINNKETELKKRLINERQVGKFIDYHINIEELQEIPILDIRKKVAKGELSSIIFAKLTNQALLTDDQKARNIAQSIIDYDKVQTTPKLFGWLFYINQLSDSDKGSIIEEHNSFNRPLGKYFQDIYLLACANRLADLNVKIN